MLTALTSAVQDRIAMDKKWYADIGFWFVGHPELTVNGRLGNHWSGETQSNVCGLKDRRPGRVPT
jgi:hypothetical protein